MMYIEVASRSEVGARSYNEDDLRHGRSGSQVHAVLSDGAGGHSHGAIASDLVVRSMALSLQRIGDWPQAQASQVLAQAVLQAQDTLNAGQEGLKAHQRMHATVVALWLDAQARQAVWAHVGDSRLYRVRQGVAEQLTQDDSVVQQMVNAGFITPEDARHHPRKNQLLAAMGSEEPLQVHTPGPPQPLEEGDAYLLCCDGWWDSLSPNDIARMLEASGSPQAWLDRMAAHIELAQVPNQDNFSAIALWAGNPHEVTRIGG
jgi:serine/threonine protein phosphatase PrpC